MSTFVSQIRQMYAWAVRASSTLQSPLLLFVRVYWGVQMAQTGWGKLHNLSHVTEFFTSLGLPAPGFTAVFISTIEFTFGILLAVGLLSRFVGLVLTVDMLMAYIIGDREELFSIFSDTSKFYAAAPYTFLCAALLIWIIGPGKISLDTLLLRWWPYRERSSGE
ncbi:MAG TPA: DoxX family protein [Candidatus Eremiobacteraceae bacterium]|nr:DoxX family protein [Candidatus Eremiobacteraceae bacterium]